MGYHPSDEGVTEEGGDVLRGEGEVFEGVCFGFRGGELGFEFGEVGGGFGAEDVVVGIEEGGVVADDYFGFVGVVTGGWEGFAIVEVHEGVGCH